MINKFDGLDWVLSNGQRPFRYKIEFTLPPNLQGKAGKFANNGFDMLCKEVKLPDIKINQNQIGIFGRTVNLPSVREFKNTIPVTFYVDETSFSRRTIEYWALMCDSSGLGKEQAPNKVGSGVIPFGGAGALDSLLGSDVLTKPYIQETSDYTKGEMANLVGTNTYYFGDMTVYAQNYSGNIVFSYKFYNVYPISTSTTPFEDSTTDRIVEFTAEFSYTTFEYDGNWSLNIF